MNASELQALIDEEQGALDRKHGIGCGFSGPATAAYLSGYGSDAAMQSRIQAQHEYANAHLDHGWHT